MARFIEVTVASGSTRMLNTDQIAEVSANESDGTATILMVSSVIHPTKMQYADVKRLLASPAAK